MVGELAVVDALEDPSEDGGRLKASLFVLAVLSGKTAAVRWAAAFVFDNIEDKQVVSKLRMARLRAGSSLACGLT